MPSSSSSSCSSSSCSSSCSSSSSYTGFNATKSSVSEGNFEILAHYNDEGTHVLVNSGVAYDGYGNRLVRNYRSVVELDWSDISGSFAYLCIRRDSTYKFVDYQDHPVYGLPKATKKDVDVQFYLSESIIAVDFEKGIAYYAPLDSDSIIEGLVLGKLYKQNPITGVIESAPEMVPYRSPYLAVKDGTFFNLKGFNVS